MAATDPVAIVAGKPLATLPPSLYVPPKALRIFLDTFEGPLDLLDYLIRRDNMDVLDIPMTELTRQYLEYVDEIVDRNIELAADYLLMSATLIEVKSRMLLPVPETEGEETVEDPRADLVRRLLKYTRIREAALAMLGYEIVGRDRWPARVAPPTRGQRPPRIDQRSLQRAMMGIKDRREIAADLSVSTDNFSTREAMAHLFGCLRSASSWVFSRLLGREHATRNRVGVFFTAVLEMAKEQLVRVEQHDDSEVLVSPRMGKSRTQEDETK